MAVAELTDDDWKLIVERIYEPYCACVPFLGAAVNVKSESAGYPGLPLGADVTRCLVKELLGKEIPNVWEQVKLTNILLQKLDNLDGLLLQHPELATLPETTKALLAFSEEHRDLARTDVEDLVRFSLYFQHKRD